MKNKFPKFPKQLKIGGQIFKIQLKKLKNDAMGECDSSNNIITIDPDLINSQRWATLIHEVFHAMNTTVGDSAYGHAFLDSISAQFHSFLSDNKLLK